MLKSCVGPCKVLPGHGCSSVTKYFIFRHVAVQTQPRQQLRFKSSSAGRPKSRRDNNSPSEATYTRPSSKSKPAVPEARKEVAHQSHSVHSKPPLPAHPLHTPNHGNDAGYTPLTIHPIKPTPNQDLSSTRPAELETVLGPEEDKEGNIAIATRANYFYRLGKSYLTFYKTGLKNIWSNRKEYNAIKARLGNYTLEYAALYGGNKVQNADGSKIENVPTITRREYQLCLRTRHDLGKLLPFGTVLAICGEFTPLVILALGSSVVPFNCRIPKQVQHDRRWFLKRLEKNALVREREAQRHGAKTPEHGNALAFLHGVSPVADLPPIFERLFYRFWVHRRLIRRGWQILADTVLIRREGGFDVLEPIEIYEYANKFFCPELVLESKTELQLTGRISWEPKAAPALGSLLERHATAMLAQDWRNIPEQVRFQYGLHYDGGILSAYQAVEKDYERTGKLPF